ncbi:hypothetical protein [Sphingomonas sp.]|uniref:hypothetical protein n=1 Tax=Sphingomonas sp. TaxID=28214 RepID=UPI003CC541AA
MAALTAARSTPLRETQQVESHPVKAATRIFPGALVCLDATGFAVPGGVATTLRPVGRAEAIADNTAGASGDIQVRVRRGVFRFANSAAGDLIARADVLGTAFIVDDQTVAKTNGGGTRSAAGTIRDVDAQGVWVLF